MPACVAMAALSTICQSLRVVDELEERYAEFRGLNLTFECREGILKALAQCATHALLAILESASSVANSLASKRSC